MSAISDIIIDIQEMLAEGFPSLAIAQALEIPVEWVEEEKDKMRREGDL